MDDSVERCSPASLTDGVPPPAFALRGGSLLWAPLRIVGYVPGLRFTNPGYDSVCVLARNR
ncbi:MAG: hypothetical protein WDN04_01010 [Rhodospirillales bacterium]